MKYNYLDLAKEARIQQLDLSLTDRLPAHFTAPVEMQVEFEVISQGDYCLLRLKSAATLSLICQRCLDEASLNYQNDIEIALCDNDKQAEQLMETYECIVAGNHFIDLVEIVTDELHLYAPDRHEEDCLNK